MVHILTCCTVILLITSPCLIFRVHNIVTFYVHCDALGGSLFSRNEVLRVAEKRRGEIADYCNRLVTLPPRVAEFPKLLEFFELRDDDLNIPGLSK